MTRLLVVVVVGCSAPAVHHASSASAPLSLAADAQMIAIPGGQYIAGSTPEEREAAYDDFATTAGISSSNAAVRVFRAREALRLQVKRCCGACADDNCRDCTCHVSSSKP